MTESRHPSTLALDEHLAGTSSDEGVAEHVAACARCQQRLDEMRASHESFLASYPSLDSLPRRAAPRQSRILRWRFQWALGGTFAAAAAALVLAIVPGEESGIRTKGGSVVEIAVGRDGESSSFHGQPLRAGDKLAFRYSTAHRYFILASVESSGQISVLLPPGGSQSMTIEPGNKMRLAHGIELDDYPGPELLVAVLSAEPIAADNLIEALGAHVTVAEDERTALPELGLGEQITWRLTKETPP